MTDMDNTAIDTNSRTAQFHSGQQGDGTGVHIASALPEAKQASPAFDPSGSVLFAANRWSPIGNASSDSTISINDPYGKGMRDQLKAEVR